MKALVKAPQPAGPPAAFTPARSLLLQRKCACAAGAPECAACHQKEAKQKTEDEKKLPQPGQKIQRASAGGKTPAATPPIVNTVLNSPGRPMDVPARSFMESRFGRDFGGVRIHTDRTAAESAQAVDAHAYTVGQHIVFDQGKYEPHSAAGQQLLAHELAHTVQQHGLQRHSDHLPLAETGEYRNLEREADDAARSALNGSRPALSSHPAQPLISRAKTATSKEPTKDEQPDRDWEPVSAGSRLGTVGVKQKAKPGRGADERIMAFNMGKLELPSEKGPVLKTWQDRANAGALEAIMEPGEEEPRTRAGLKQDRPRTDELRDIWRQKVGWTEDEADAKWKAGGGAAAKFIPPQVKDGSATRTCQVDHILELQFGGSNDRNNLQMLDGDPNQKSGRELFRYLKEKATAIRNVLDAENPNNPVQLIQLHFDTVTQSATPICQQCCTVEKKAMAGAAATPGESVEGAKGEPFALSAGGTATSIIIPTDLVKDKKKPVEVRNSPIPENKSASTLISGLLLDTLRRDKNQMAAVLDTGSRLPVTVEKEKPVDLHVAKDGKLSLPHGRQNLKFHYPYLSDGVFTELKLNDDGSISGRGSLTPSVSFLPKLEVKFDKDAFGLAVPIKKPNPPIPGAKITEAEIGLDLAPQFKPYGHLAFELAPGGKKVLDGQLELSADANGLVADGLIHVFLPGVDNAEGHLTYRNQEWSGGAKIETSQLQTKLKYIKSGSVEVTFGKGHLGATGTVMLNLPHTEGVEASLYYERQRWVFKGKGTFNPPRLKPVTIAIEYDGTHIEGMAETEFEFHSLKGKIKVLYRDEHFSGEGTIEINKGRAKGKLHVKMHPNARFSGEGELTYQISENLIATAGIEVNDKEEVRFKGALEFPKPIPLFKPFGDEYKFFEVGIEIPIPGASIGPIGLKATIKGSLSAGYQIGPGELRNAKIQAAFNPLDENPDLDVDVGAQLYIGASAHITGKISGGVEVSVGVAAVGGNLTITATATLEGHVASKATIHYQKSKLTVDADFEALLALAIDLALQACVTAEAGVWKLKVSTEKCWTLAKYHYDPGLKLGMKLKKPIHWGSDEGFQFPSVNDFDWNPPSVDPKDVLEKTFSNAPTKEEDK